MIPNNKMLRRFTDEYSKQEIIDLEKERFECYKNFDHSDIRLNTETSDSEDNVFVLAYACKDHIELVTKSWISEFRYFENIIYVLNHECLHIPIDRIIFEDGFDRLAFDGEWMFYAGGMDELLGLNMSKNAPTCYLNPEAVKNTLSMFPKTSFQCRETIHGDYDL